MPTSFNRPNKFDYVSRKVFDRETDRLRVRIQRAKEDGRADMGVLIKQIRSLENQLTDLAEHIQRHCHQLDEHRAGSPFLDKDTRDSE